MNEKIFRKKSIDRVSSPEQIDDYLRVSNPSVWVLIFAAVILIIGAMIWGTFGKLERTVNCVAVADRGTVTLYVKEEDSELIRSGLDVKVNKKTFPIKDTEYDPVCVDYSFGDYMLHLGEFEIGGWAYVYEADGILPSGIYSAKIVTENASPLELLFKQKNKTSN